MTEFDFIRRYLNRQQEDADVILGIGDDAAIIRPKTGFDLCFSSDMLLKNRHFFSDVLPEDLAWKVLAVNISDMAAMGAKPRWALLSAGLPELDETWLERFCSSLFELANRFGVRLIGGDTTRGDLVFNVTIAGELPQGRALRRDAAKIGDDVWVSGEIGSAAAALNCHLKKCVLPDDVFVHCEAKLLRPLPRVALGLGILPLAHAAQDISDGLAQDVGHILNASAMGMELWADCLPVYPPLKTHLDEQTWLACALAGGDDYELVFTAPEVNRECLLAAAQQADVPISRIGKVTDTCRLKIAETRGGKELNLTKTGFDHFG